MNENIELVVGQQLTLNTFLEAGEITEQKTVTSEAPLVDVSTAQVAGIVGEREVKDLPLNGRSVDDLITLNPATVNTTAVKGEASGSSGPGNNFAIAGQRPGHNIFLWNGVEYPGGSNAESSTPGGVSGQLLGIDAVREFNVVPALTVAFDSRLEVIAFTELGKTRRMAVRLAGSRNGQGLAEERFEMQCPRLRAWRGGDHNP